VEVKPGVTVVALDKDKVVHLTSEFHYAVGRVTLEGVSGGIENGESPLASAQRELIEELGIVARQWTSLGVVDPFTSAVRSPVQLYLAEDLSFEATQMEGTELIERVSMPLAEAIAAVMDCRITHAPTCVALLKVAQRLQGSK
jgi:ADP-ribose pyrophosphatase